VPEENRGWNFPWGKTVGGIREEYEYVMKKRSDWSKRGAGEKSLSGKKKKGTNGRAGKRGAGLSGGGWVFFSQIGGKKKSNHNGISSG